MIGALLLAAAVAAPTWVPVATSPNGQTFSAEAESLAAAKPHQVNRVWVKMALPPSGGQSRAEIVGLEQIDCEARSYQVLQSSVRFPDLSDGSTEHGPEPIKYIAPGSAASPGTILLDRVCR